MLDVRQPRMNITFESKLGLTSIIQLDLNASLIECEYMCVLIDRRHIHRIWIKNVPIQHSRRHTLFDYCYYHHRCRRYSFDFDLIHMYMYAYVNMNGPLNALKLQLNL